MDKNVRKYLSAIGSKGGRISRRELSTQQAKSMVSVREARKAFKKYRTSCFWSYDPEFRITLKDVPWIRKQLMKYGNRDAWQIGASLCP